MVEGGRVVAAVRGRTHAVAPEFDPGITSPLGAYFDRYHLQRMDNFGLQPEWLPQALGAEFVLH